jgi:hypothetical protein
MAATRRTSGRMARLAVHPGSSRRFAAKRLPASSADHLGQGTRGAITGINTNLAGTCERRTLPGTGNHAPLSGPCSVGVCTHHRGPAGANS